MSKDFSTSTQYEISRKHFWLDFVLPEGQMGITKTQVALCKFFVDAPQKAQYRQPAIFFILSFLLFTPYKLQETYISALSETIYSSGRATGISLQNISRNQY